MKNDVFETDEIYLVAYLMMKGCVMTNTKRMGSKVLFMFSQENDPKSHRRDFYSGKGSFHEYSQRVIAAKKMCFFEP